MVSKACYQILIVCKPVGSEYKFQFKFGRKRQRMESNEQRFVSWAITEECTKRRSLNRVTGPVIFQKYQRPSLGMSHDVPCNIASINFTDDDNMLYLS